MVSADSTKPVRRRPNTVAVDLQDLKPKWLAWCGSVRVTPSEALRAIVKRLENGSWPGSAQKGPVEAVSTARRSKAVSVRPRVPLSQEEAESAKILADAEGVSVQWWIAGVVRARVADQSPIGRPALKALGDATLQLQAIGRNVNQIARALNAMADHLAKGRMREYAQEAENARGLPRQEMLEEIIRLIDAERAAIRDVLDENEQRWGVRRARGGGRGPV
jgi:hypothetical protein